MNSCDKILKLSGITFGLFLFLWLTFPFQPVSATHLSGLQPLSGYAWSSNIGWISFTSANCDADNNGQSDGAVPDCPSAGTPMAHYGVMRATNGNLSGYAWSDKIGWTIFNPSMPPNPPTLPNQSANIPLSGPATGWARALANDASWDGWIKFDSGGNYGPGVVLGGSDGCTLTGYAWGSNVIGWISMSGLTDPSGQPYGVKVKCNGDVSSLTTDALISSGAYCSSTPTPMISWTFTDPFGNTNTQTGYQIQVSSLSDTSFALPIYQTTPVPIQSSATLIPIPSGVLTYNTTYNYRVRAWLGSPPVNPSQWTSAQFTTAPHQGPSVDFRISPAIPTQGRITIFTDASIFFGGANFLSRNWTFASTPVASPSSSTVSPVNVTLNAKFTTVTLQVTDTSGLTCSLPASSQNTIRAVLPIVEFKEVK